MQSATQSSNQPLGGSSGDWRYRLLRYHAPIAVASAVMFVLFMTLPPFDPQVYPQANMAASGAIPQRMDMGSDASHSQQPGAGGMMDHGANQTPPPTSHGGSQTSSPSGHGGSQTSGTDHGKGQTPATGHGTDQTGQMDSGGMT